MFNLIILTDFVAAIPVTMDTTVTTKTSCHWFRVIPTVSEFPNLHHQIPQRHHTNLFPAPLIVILQTCNL